MADRKSAFTLTNAEQDAFKAAVTTLITNGTYGTLVKIHSDMSHQMHTMGGSGSKGTLRFLSWHRAYILHYEQELQKIDKTVTLPYWKWVDGGVPGWLTGFKPTVNGVTNNRVNLTAAITDKARIDTLLKKTDYLDFSYSLELDPHNQGHVKLGDPMRNVPTAPCDPIFWMHHGEVDRIWASWQATYPGKGPLLTGSDAVMDPWTDTVASLDSIGALGYKYA